MGFSESVQSVQKRIFSSDLTDEQMADPINAWLATDAQPCIFGRAAARKKTITYCVLSDDVLTKSDDAIIQKIRRDRLAYEGLSALGRSSAFVLLALSPRLAWARPDENLKRFAGRLLELWLGQDNVLADQSLSDKVWLDLEFARGKRRSASLHWDVEVNFFGAQGDGRWWQDHRIPGGIAFTANAIGHLVASQNYAEAILEASGVALKGQMVDSLGGALVFAMRTIAGAHDHPKSGRATELFTMTEKEHANLHVSFKRCPFAPLAASDPVHLKDYSRYRGWFHTNHALPSIFFNDAIERPEFVTSHDDIDLSYLFDDSRGNQDYWRFGQGLLRGP